MTRTLSEIEDDLRELVVTTAEANRVPGVSIGVVHQGEELYVSHGVTNLADPQEITPDTLFFIGSTSKTFCATVVMALVSQGLFELDDPVSKHVPALPVQDPEVAQRVTFGQLLDHTSGFVGDTETTAGWGDDALGKAAVEMLSSAAQFTPLGAHLSYSNLAVTACGWVLEQITGESYEALVRKHVLEPLGMDSSFFFPWEVASRRFAVGHIDHPDGAIPNLVYPSERWLAPAGGLLSTARDQMRYALFHLDGVSVATPPIDDATRALMQQPRVSSKSIITGAGVSWLLHDFAGLTLIEHGGNLSNQQLSDFCLAPSERFAYTSLSNSVGGRAVGAAVKKALMSWLLGVEESALPAIEMPDLAEYIGVYEAGSWDVLVEPTDDGALQIGWKLTNVPDDFPQELRDTFEQRRTKLFFSAPDVLSPVDNPAGTVADFIRDDTGRIAFVRHGMRVSRRRSLFP